MTIRTLLVSLVLLLLALFAAANWNAFMAPTTLSLLLTSIQAPLGLIMLGFTALLTALFLIFIAALQAELKQEIPQKVQERAARLKTRCDAQHPQDQGTTPPSTTTQ